MAELECSEQINFEPSPEAKPAPPVNQMDDAAALLLMLSGGAEDEQPAQQTSGPPALTLPQSQLSAYGGAPSAPKSQQQFAGHVAHSTPSSASKRAVVKVDRVLRCGACAEAGPGDWSLDRGRDGERAVSGYCRWRAVLGRPSDAKRNGKDGASCKVAVRSSPLTSPLRTLAYFMRGVASRRSDQRNVLHLSSGNGAMEAAAGREGQSLKLASADRH